MIKRILTTNLDLAKSYVLAANRKNGCKGLEETPAVGSVMVFPLTDDGYNTFELLVCNVAYSFDREHNTVAHIELSIPPFPHSTIAKWEYWFKNRLGEV